MDPFDGDKDRKRRKKPFDILDDKEFERIFEEMQRMFESTSFKEMIEKELRGSLGSNKGFIHGLSINIVPLRRSKIQEFGNHQLKKPQGKTVSSEEHEPLTDIIEGKEEIAVTVEIPGVGKEDVDLNATEKALEITVNNPERKYHKLLNLPCSIKPKTAKATYKNGILDVVIKRKEKRKTGAGYRPTI
jgi:HSP20 family protein